MNAVTCDVPHRYIREMATGKNDNPDSGLPESEQEERS